MDFKFVMKKQNILIIDVHVLKMNSGMCEKMEE